MEQPGSGSPPKIFNIATSCSAAGGVVSFNANKVISGTSLGVVLLNASGEAVWGSGFGAATNGASFTTSAQPDGDYVLSADNGEATIEEPVTISCGVAAGTLKLAVSHTDETAALDDGSITLTATGSDEPVTLEVVDLSLSRATTEGAAELFADIPPGSYTVRATAGSEVVTSSVTVLAYSAPATGCTDEYADNYDPTATAGDNSCTYTPRWRSAWGPEGVAVRVSAVAGQAEGYLTAELRIGFRPGHELAPARPLGEPLRLHATVGPDGYATFCLAPYLWPTLGAEDGAGGYRLDLNSLTATTTDLFTGYELRRTTGELLEHGYALNAAVPDAQLLTGPDNILSPFAGRLPVWPGFEYNAAYLNQRNVGRFGLIDAGPVLDLDYVLQPCPPNPLPVAWLAPGGGYGYWVFSGRPQLADEVGESQGFTEAATGERRWSQRGESRGTITASSGVFSGPLFGEGLRTLWASPQVWYQPVMGGEWVPVTLGGGQFPVRRMGLPRTEFSLTFTEAVPHYAQGQ
jgi:hypothetical protein